MTRPLLRKAFTLIELLIVVAISAILAAIAVPNFLEAQTRARVTRVASDMRTLATAMESYFIDNNAYPRDHDNFPGSTLESLDRFNINNQVGWYYLTTPVAYVTTIAKDPFAWSRRSQWRPQEGAYESPHYILSSGSDNERFSGVPNCPCYFMNTIGPDQLDNTGDQDKFPYGGASMYVLFYDPTNGTISDGDIYRFGGEYRQGDWVIGDRRTRDFRFWFAWPGLKEQMP